MATEPRSPLPEYLTPQQIAQAYQVTPRTVERWVAQGALPAQRVGPKLWRIARADLDAFAASARKAASS